MTVSPNRTMLPPIWVAACDSQSRRNPPFRKTASASAGGAVAEGGLLGGGRGASRRPGRRCGRRPSGADTAAVIAGSPRADEPDEAPLERRAARAGRGGRRSAQRRPMSAPSRSTSQVSPPHGCVAAEPDDVAEEQREDGLVWHRRVRVSKAGTPVRRDERPGGRRQLEPVDRCDRHDDVRLRRGELGDDAAGAGQRAGQLVRRADGLDLEAGSPSAVPSTPAAPGAPVTTTPVTTRVSPTAIASAPALRSSLMSSSTPGPSIGPLTEIVTPGSGRPGRARRRPARAGGRR